MNIQTILVVRLSKLSSFSLKQCLSWESSSAVLHLERHEDSFSSLHQKGKEQMSDHEPLSRLMILFERERPCADVDEFCREWQASISRECGC